MNNIDVLLVYLLPVICFVLIMISFKYDKTFAIVNTMLFCAYTIILFWLAWAEGGHGQLLWLAFSVVLNIIQILVVGIFVIIFRYKIKKNKL